MRQPKQKSPYVNTAGINHEELIFSKHIATLKDIKADPILYTDLVLDLLAHWQLGTKETQTMGYFKDFFNK